MSPLRFALLGACVVGIALVGAGVPGVSGGSGAAGSPGAASGPGVAAMATSTPSVTPTGSNATAANGTTPTPSPSVVGTCPSFRGVASLCEPTAPPTSTQTDGAAVGRPPTSTDDAGTPGSAARVGPAGWLSGLTSLLAWAVAVVVAAPLVLGGLLLVVPGTDEGG